MGRIFRPEQGKERDRDERRKHASERRGDGVAINIFGEQDLKIFESGVKYFK